MKTGDKIKLEGEKQRYIVQAFDDRFVIMTKPFNAKRTYLYTIADKKRMERGPIGLIFGLSEPIDTPEQARQFLSHMKHFDWQISYRNSIALKAEEIERLWPNG